MRKPLLVLSLLLPPLGTAALIPAAHAEQKAAIESTQPVPPATATSATALLATAPADTPSTVPEAAGFADYKIIIDRNIFDPARRAPVYSARKTTLTTETLRPAGPAARMELVGILIQDGTARAFFNGYPSAHTGSCELGGSIGGFQLGGLFTDRVYLERDGKVFELGVGQQIELNDKVWSVNAAYVPRFEDAAMTTASAALTSGTQSAEPPPGASDLLKRMMERRLRGE